MKTCNTCKETKPYPAFSKQKNSKDGYAYKCKLCGNIRSLEYHKQKHISDERYRARKLLGASKQNAKSRKLEFDIDLEWLVNKLNSGVCELTKIPFQYEYTGNCRRNPYAPSLDRRDNLQGYTKANVRVVLWGVNQALNEYGLETMSPIFKSLAKL